MRMGMNRGARVDGFRGIEVIVVCWGTPTQNA